MNTFTQKKSTWMHIDFNSCFATIEQQANPSLRNKPIGVVAYDSPNGCILAPSIEAKRYGIKTGMRAKEGRALCPQLITLTGDVQKYRYAHHQLKDLIAEYSNDFWPKSIDEFIVNFDGYPALNQGYQKLGKEIKKRITETIGDWMRVSIGFGPNRFLAKLAASIRKPDGLLEINQDNFMQIYESLTLQDLNGIAHRNEIRLKSVGIYSVPAFYYATREKIKTAFASRVAANYWHLALRGYQIDAIEYQRRSFSSEYSPPFKITNLEEAKPVVMKLSQRTAYRMRKEGFVAKGIHCSARFKNGQKWKSHQRMQHIVFETSEVYQTVQHLLKQCPFPSPIRTLSLGCFDVTPVENDWQYDLFGDMNKKVNLTKAMDSVNDTFGKYTVMLGTMLGTNELVPDRVSFGKVKEA